MKLLRSLGTKIPKWLRPSPETARQGRAVLKAFAKGAIIAGAGILANQKGAPPEASLAIAGVVHALIKWIDPADPQFGINAA